MVQTAIAGEIDLSITYDPFGEIVSGVDANFVGFAYNGEETNQVTGLQYLRARYYDSDLGSFLTIDSYLGSLTDVTSQNRYTYANNDPVNNIDPSGHYSTNVNGTMQYYQSTGLNELRDYMTAAGFWAGQVQAQNSFNASVYRAQSTNFMNYQSISGISQATANNYVYNGIAKAGQVSMNYGCAVPTVPYAAVNRFESNVNAAKNSANAQISQIKAQKKVQYDNYMAYLKWLEEQKRIAAEKAAQEQAKAKEALQKEAEQFFEKNFGKDFTPENISSLSQQQLKQFVDYLSKYIIALAPDLTIGKNEYFEIPVGVDAKIYYGISLTGTVNKNKLGEINLKVEDQKIMFDTFSTSANFGNFSVDVASDGGVSITASSAFTPNTASFMLEHNFYEGKTSVEYSVETDIGNNSSVSSRIGLEKYNQNLPSPQPEYVPAYDYTPSYEYERNPNWGWVPYAVGGVAFIIGLGIMVYTGGAYQPTFAPAW